MGRTVYWMNVSLDLYIDDSYATDGQGDWLRIGEQLHREFNRRAANLAAMVNGRVVYEIMESSWPDIATDETMPEYMREYGRIWLDAPKYLVSRTRAEAGYDTVVISGPDAMSQLEELRDETAGEIGVGGAHLATQMLETGLLDELLLFTHPVVLGAGRPLFDRVDRPVDLELVETTGFEMGVTMSRYAILGV